MICSSYNVQFLYSAFSLLKLGQSALHVYFITPWQTCYTNHLLNSLGSIPGGCIHPLTRFKALRVSKYNCHICLYAARYSFTAEWNRGTIVATRSPRGTVFNEPTVFFFLAGLEPTILWLGVLRANHSAIATRRTNIPCTVDKCQCSNQCLNNNKNNTI